MSIYLGNPCIIAKKITLLTHFIEYSETLLNRINSLKSQNSHDADNLIINDLFTTMLHESVGISYKFSTELN